nr:PREDICTED: tetratricopeptide repeat protein 28-like [Paralichthys olivaceus]
MEKPATLKGKFSIFSSRAAGRPIRCVGGDDMARYGLSKAEFMEKVQQSNEACQRGDFEAAVHLYSEALRADPQNCILYSNRSAALLKMGQHQVALEDAEKACELNPKWPKAYFRQGVALQYLGRHADALAAFASGLAQDPKSLQLLVGMIEAAMKSPLRESLEPTYQQLQKMKLDKSPFVVVSVIGQELLTASHHTASVVVLEAALKIGTCSLKLRGSVFSALSSAHWSLGNTEKSTGYMQQDLEVAKTLGDQTGECRAHGNLGSAFFSKGNYREALTNHRNQLVLAMKLKDREAASMALSSLGHVYTAIGDYPNALASHKQCVLLAKQSKDQLSEARELGNMGAVYIAMGDFENAVQCHEQHLGIAKALENKREEARAYSNLGSAYHYHRNFDKAMSYHTHVLELAQELEEKSIEMRAYAGLGHAARCMQDLERAKQYHEQQLSIAEGLKDRAAEGRASSNLGIIHQMKGDYETALKLHKTHLAIAQELNDYAAQGRAYGNMGNAYNALGAFDQAVRYHRQELQISMEVNDRASQASTHGNLAVAYQALGAHDRALQHYQNHLNIARELRDVQSEARALGNLGNFHCSRGEFPQAVPYYEQYLRLSPDLQDMESEGKVCHNLGYAHYCLGNYQDAVKYYEQDLALAKDLHDKLSQAKAYCNLGLAFKALGDFTKAEECQKYLLSLAQSLNNAQARFRALGNLGDIFVCKKDVAGAIQFYEQQLALAHQVKERRMEACAYAALGATYRLVQKYDKALGYHTQELEVYQELGDVSGECKAHGHLAAVYMALGKYAMAFKSYEEQLELGRRLKDPVVEAQVYGNMGITKMNVGVMEEAIGYLEQQLATLQQLSGNEAVMDRGRAYGNLGDCYEALGDFEEAIKYYDQYLSVAQSLNRMQDQEKAYRGLGNGHRAMGHLQQSLVCFEKRLVVAHELGECGGKAQAYGELGALHSQLGNYEQAISCLERQLVIARDTQDRLLEGDASCGLGVVYQSMGEYETALRCHQSDLEIAEETGSPTRQARAYGNLGLTYESLGNYERAVVFQEQHLSVAAQTNDLAAKTLAYGSLGRTHHALQNYSQAVMYLQEVLECFHMHCFVLCLYRSCQSMTSLFSNTMSPAKDGNSSLPRRSSNLGKPPLRALYDLLIAPMEGGLMHSSGPVGRHRQLVMVLEGELYLIPFALLKGSSSNEYLYERFSLIAVPSIHGLGSSVKAHSRRPGPAPCGGVSMAAVVGNPRLPSPVMDRWLWGPMPSAEEEALMVAELLGCQPLAGSSATKERVMSALTQAECAHFATHISWKLAALVLTPNPEGVPGGASASVGVGTVGRGAGGRRGSSGRGRKGSIGSGYTIPESLHMQDDSSDVESICDSPPLQEFLLTAADILDLRLPVKLVVLGSYQESSSKVTADGVVGLTRAFLAAGAQCVLVSLWPVPVAASKVFVHAFYTALLNGTKASAALADAMKTVQSSKQYSHPSNWAGYMLIGNDVKLNSPSSLIGQALAEILQFPDRVRDALRVLLHLVEKSLQRIQNGQRNSMYTSQQSVENKVGGIPGWQALLTAVGFRLDSAGTGIPAAVFFPTADPGDRLQQCSTTLQSLLGLPPPALQALCKLITASEAGEQLINRAVKNMVAMLHQVLVQLQTGEKEQDFSLLPIQVSISVQLWRLPGCHEFLAALGFDLCEVGQEEVVLKTGKLANRRTLHFALQSLLALFDSTELPKRLSLDSSSSLESLASAQSVSNPMPMGYSSLPFSPHCLDNQASDAISVYSLSSVASSMSFASKSECDFLSHRQRSGATAHYSIHKHPHVPRSRSSPHGAAAAVAGARGDEEEYEGFSIISSEPLGSHCDSLPLPPGHSQRHHRGGRGVVGGSGTGAGRGYTVSVSSRGSVSTPTSPVKTCLVPSPNSPFQKVGKVSSSDTGESDQSSTETDSTVKSQEEKTVPLDPQELAQKILEETQSHLRAVGSLQRAGAEGGTAGGTSARSSAFRSSETSAFSRPNSSASGRAQSSPKPKPPSRSSSLQKISSGYNSPAVSESSQKEGSHPSPTLDSHAQLKLKYPSSPYSGHISRSPSNVSPSSGHQSPAGSAPSPALSYSSTGSACSTSADAPDLDRLRRGVIDEKVQAIHNLKTFWANAAAQQQQHLRPVRAIHSSPGPLASASRDVLSLLNLSPRRCSPNDTQDSLELRELGLQSLERGSKNSSNGHHCSNSRKGAPSPTISTSSSPGARSIRLPAGNGYKFLSPGRFFPSSKC